MGEQISKDLPVVSSTEGKGVLLSPDQQNESLNVQQETSATVQNILEEVARDLLESQSSEPKHQTLDPEQPDNSLIGLPVQGAARAPLANFEKVLAIFRKNVILELCKGVHCVDLGESFPIVPFFSIFFSNRS